jgi:hypothetical protein
MLQFVQQEPPKVAPTNLQLVQAFIVLRDKIEAIQTDYNNRMMAEIGPLQEHLQTLEALLTNELNKLGQNGGASIKTTVGTVYRERWDQYKVTNREEWIDWVFNTQAESMVTNHTSKEAIKTHVEEHNGLLPPGIGHEFGYKTKVRRS